jgi:hypothetical protein
MKCMERRWSAFCVVASLAMLLACAGQKASTQNAMSTPFANEIGVARRTLQGNAKQAIPQLPDDTIIIGFLQTRPFAPDNLTYVPSELRIVFQPPPPPSSPIAVAWISWEAPFTLSLTAGTPWPFTESRPQPPRKDIESSTGQAPYWAIMHVDPNAPRRRYHFAVQLVGIPGGDDPDCPPIIIN